ncbi:hypothetical protein DJ013_06885 [Arcticibacterium luteifluviistationis]|uniref:Uncharacterized protein n=1 Tax=Arcticibacterium luteifluviistationis TaxID=1784714 RepID=A0A2Z4G9P1_9BACT|nr:hypothetical protein DJ013_06885 [Arcticibacterium luteifluviistationis]
MKLQQIYLGVVLLAFLIGLLNFKSLVFSVRLLCVLLGIVFIVETSGYTLREVIGINNQFLFHIYGPIEYMFLSYLYYSHLKSQSQKKFILLSIPLFLLLSISTSLFFQELTETPYNFLLRCFLIILFCLLYFAQLYKSSEVFDIYRIPLFWISVGHFIFYGGSFFLMGLIDEIEKIDIGIAKSLFQINTYLNIFLYSMFIIAFTCNRKKRV